jgi:putative membrane protein
MDPDFRSQPLPEMMRNISLASLLMLAMATVAVAHEGEPPKPHDLLTAWEFDPGIVAPLLLSGWLYLRGKRRLRSARKSAIRAYSCGWLALVIALVSPIHTVGESLLSVHMLQHSILMLVAAPLIVASRPLTVYLFALPPAWRHWVADFPKRRWFQNLWRRLTDPFVAFATSGIALWLWHIPGLYQQTLVSDLMHSAQHITFLLMAVLFWWAMIYGRVYGASAAYLFITAVHTSVLGALMTLSHSLWYPVYAGRTEPWGLTPLEDQQLAGLVMWVPCGMVYLFVALVSVAFWLRQSDRTSVKGSNGGVAFRSSYNSKCYQDKIGG